MRKHDREASKIIKRICLIIFIGIISAVLFSCRTITDDSPPVIIDWDEPDTSSFPRTMDFEYIGETEYEDEEYLRRKRVSEGDRYTYWITVSSYEWFEDMSEDDDTRYWPHFTLPEDFDFDNYSLLVTFGIKPHSLELTHSVKPYGSPPGLVTLGHPCIYLTTVFNTQYYGNRAFFYKVEKHRYDLPFAIAPCYVMINGERVFIDEMAEGLLYFFSAKREWREWGKNMIMSYRRGSCVMYEGRRWISTAINNGYRPGVYGWLDVDWTRFDDSPMIQGQAAYEADENETIADMAQEENK